MSLGTIRFLTEENQVSVPHGSMLVDLSPLMTIQLIFLKNKIQDGVFEL